MTGPEHYELAEKFATEAAEYASSAPGLSRTLTDLAHVHIGLAHVALTAMNRAADIPRRVDSESAAWRKAAGVDR